MITRPASDVVVRDARPDDAARIVQLIHLGALHPSPVQPGEVEGTAAAIGQLTAEGPGTVLVAERDGAVVATVQLLVFRHVQQGGAWCAELESMHTHPDQRGTGVGAALIEAAVERARASGCYRIQLTSNLDRVDAHRFYERHGFVRTHAGFKRPLA